jgi:uncharacterized protein (TIGR03435 family)
MKKLGLGMAGLAFAFKLLSASAQSAAPPAAVSVPDAKLPVYDAVVIKPNSSGSGSSRISSNADLYNATNVSLKALLQDAYNVKADMITGVPKDMESAHFDIQAKVIEPDLDVLKKLDLDQRRAMRRAILLDRFQLQVHTEVKTLPVYEMSLTKDGPKFKESTSTGNGSSTHTHNIPHGTELNARNVTMASFAGTLYSEVHRTVLDKTGLAGKYDIDMKWSPDDAATPDPDAGPSVYTALQEQLGLKLQSAKGPVETLVVDHVEMPSAN